MLEEIKRDALAVQIENAAPGQLMDDIFPETLSIQDIDEKIQIGLSEAANSAGEVDRMMKRTAAFTLAVGRLMWLASKRPEEEIQELGFPSFTQYQRDRYEKYGSESWRWDAMALYESVREQPVAELRKCTLGNLKVVKRLVAAGASEKQTERLVTLAQEKPRDFRQALEDEGFMAPGEAFTGHLTVHGAQGRIQELKDWLARKDVKELGAEVDALIAATAEFDSTGPSAIQAAVILREMAARAERLGKWDMVMDEEAETAIRAWLKQATPTAVVDADFQEG